ncbi:unnamed protein product, partial [Phaeothamnion confervicola]
QAQITDASNRTRGFSMLSLAWGGGVMVAPMLGGLLSHPAERFPGTFPPESSLFAAYPYMLPCVGAMVIQLIAVAVCIVYMKDPPRAGRRNGGNGGSGRSDGGVEVPIADGIASGGGEPGGAQHGRSGGGGLCSKEIAVVVACYTVLAMAHVLFDETVPLWCKVAPADGGLGFDARRIGALLSAGGVSLMLITLFIMPRMGRAGYLRMLRWGGLGSAPLFALYPLQALLVHADGSFSPWLWPVLVAAAAWRNLVSTMSFTAVIVLLNHTVPADRLGFVNGVGQLFASAARTVGPALGGVLWSYSVRVGFIYANFFICGALLLVSYLLALVTPAALEHARHG